MRGKRSPIVTLAPQVRGTSLRVVIETPKGTRNKFDFDEKLLLFRLGVVLPAGESFPYDFGFIPRTLGEDGDPLDVMLLMDEPAFPGCVIDVRLVGVIEARQTSDGQRYRNDRLIAVARESHDHRHVRTIRDLEPHLLDEIETFFITYNKMKGAKFRPLGRYGPKRAAALVAKGQRAWKKKKS